MQRLDNVVQRYPWGDRRAIWDLLGVDGHDEPAAELWMGAHPLAPSRLVPAGSRLDHVIEADAPAALGPAADDFGARLPFLCKVLAAAQPLSLQAHPDAARAEAGFRREEQAGVARDHPRRTYRDPAHKPELICAVTPFWACCGFRPVDATRQLLDVLDDPGLAPLRHRLASDAPVAEVLADAVRWLLRLDAAEAGELVAAIARAAGSAGDGAFAAERHWASRLATDHPGDPGVAVALLLNVVELAPGEALFLGAGNLHCYLQGLGVEVMANSDNVVRGGLTTKHVDVDELLAVLDASPLEAEVQRPSGPVHTYHSPVAEFALTRLLLDGSPVRRPAGPRIVVVIDGSVALDGPTDRLELVRGQSAWVAAGDGPVEVTGSGLAYDVTVGAVSGLPGAAGAEDRRGAARPGDPNSRSVGTAL